MGHESCHRRTLRPIACEVRGLSRVDFEAHGVWTRVARAGVVYVLCSRGCRGSDT